MEGSEMEKENKEATPEKKYVAFHRERQEPIDCFTRHEVDKKLKSLREVFNKKLQSQKDKIEESHKEELDKIRTQFDNILKKISQKFQEYYTQEKVDQFFNVLQSGNNNVKWSFEALEKQHMKLEKLVIKYLEASDIGENVGDTFVFNEPKKKRLWKK